VRILIIDVTGNSLDFAWRCQNAGHEVKMFIRQTPKTAAIGRGLVDIVDDWQAWLRWSELAFLADNTHYLDRIDAFRKENPKCRIVGPSKQAAQWELDRKLGMEVLRKAGVAVPSSREFSDYDQAIAYVEKEDRRFVSKPSGDEPDKALSYVSKSAEDMIYMLHRWKKLGKLKTPFLLQEFVGGIEMAVGGWFGPGGFNQGWVENFEFKKLMNDDLGVSTGEQGTVLRYVKRSKLASRVLEPLTDELERLSYVGFIDVNCMIDDKGVAWPLEFTMRPGWPTFNIEMCLHTGDPAGWLAGLAEGEDNRDILFDRIAVGVVMTIPDYPYSHLTRKEVVGVPVYGISSSLWQHIHPCEMMMGKDVPCRCGNQTIMMEMPVTAGDYVLVMTAYSDTVKDAALTVYRRLKKLLVPNSPAYRTDIGKRLAKQLPKLQKRGYAMGMLYSPP
jgi:phosphoribosylamine---glycine ligase